MGWPRTGAAVGSLIVGVATSAGALAAGCGTGRQGSVPDEPTLPTVDFSADLVLDVGGDVLATRGEHADPAVRTDPPTIPSGAVIEVHNTTSSELRLRAGTAFDTGIMLPGERTTVVVTNPGPERQDLELFDVTAQVRRGALIVEPAPS